MKTAIALGCLAAILTTGCAPLNQRNATSPGANRAQELRVSFALPETRDSGWAEIFVPAGVHDVRAAVIFVDREYDRYMFDDRDWRTMCAEKSCALLRLGLPSRDAAPTDSQRIRNAALGGDSSVFTALRLAAERTGHPEMQNVGIVFFGLSAAGNFGFSFAGMHPDRTLGLIRYHSSLRGLRIDTTTLAKIPSLTIVGANDAPDIAKDSRALWQILRERGAPAAFVSHLGQQHVSIDGLVEAGRAMRLWTQAVINERVPSHTWTPKDVQESDGWLVGDSTGTVTRATSSVRSGAKASWFPTQQTAFAVRQLKGLCAVIGLRDATGLLGPGTHFESDDAGGCHYSVADPHRDVWITASSHATDSAAVAWLAQAQRATPLSGLGTAANIMVSSRTNCSTLGAAASVWTFYVSACGAGLGQLTDTSRMRPLARQLIGEP